MCSTASTSGTIKIGQPSDCFNFQTKSSYYQVDFDPGRYFVALRGASGGYTTAFKVNNPGLGGSTAGILNLKTAKTLFLFVGSQGGNSTGANGGTAGYNGGMPGGTDTGRDKNCGSAGSGGSTDLRLNGGSWNDVTGLRSRIMVAAGGGSAGCYTKGGIGGNGGGIDGSAGGTVSTVVSGGQGGKRNTGSNFGFGEQGQGSRSTLDGEAGGSGGGGYWGGFGGTAGISCESGGGGGGGSSFISGHLGCCSVDSNGNPTTNKIHFSGIRFDNTQMKAGVNLGNGFATIVRVGNYMYMTIACKRRPASSMFFVILIVAFNK